MRSISCTILIMWEKYWNSLPADINECLSSPCGGICVNTEGSYHCKCPLGQRLADDGFTCEGEDYFLTVQYLFEGVRLRKEHNTYLTPYIPLLSYLFPLVPSITPFPSSFFPPPLPPSLPPSLSLFLPLLPSSPAILPLPLSSCVLLPLSPFPIFYFLLLPHIRNWTSLSVSTMQLSKLLRSKHPILWWSSHREE